MGLALVFAVTLLFAVMISGFAHRSILSTSVLFLGAGLVLGLEPVGILTVHAGDPFVDLLVQVALFSVLFTDGMRVGLKDLTRAWRLPGRALVLGMPLVFVMIAALAHWLVDLPWLHAFLLGAVLSPTDPMFASAIVGREEVPYRLRHLLNVESGVNDGLALPVVVALVSYASSETVNFLKLGGEILGGIALGVALPWTAIRLEGTRFFQASEDYRPINAFALGLLLFILAKTFHLNQFLAAFAGGMTVATCNPVVRESFEYLGQIISELLKLLSLLVFGALMSLEYLGQTTGWEVAFVVLVLILVRPIALGLALLGGKINKPEWIAAAWFGPKGFASVVYGMYLLKMGLGSGEQLFHIVGLVVAMSILAHSSTDVLIARWFHSRSEQEAAEEEQSEKEVQPEEAAEKQAARQKKPEDAAVEE